MARYIRRLEIEKKNKKGWLRDDGGDGGGEGEPPLAYIYTYTLYKTTMMEKLEIYIYIYIIFILFYFFHSFTLDKRTFLEWQFRKNDDSKINILYIYKEQNVGELV